MIENGAIRIEAGASNFKTATGLLNNDNWHHIAVSYNAADGDKMNNVKIYIDGVYYANQPDSGDSYNSESTVIKTDNTINTIRIGAANYTSSYYWQGQLDDIRVYSRELSASEITSVMNGASLSINNNNLKKNNLIAYPNAVDSILNIKTKTIFSRKLKFEALNINGQSFKLKYIKIENQKIEIFIKNLTSGVYFVNLLDDKTKSTFKILKK